MLLLLLTFLIVFSPLALGFGLAVSLRPLHDERQRRLAQAKEMRETPRVSEPVETSTEEPENPQEVEAEPAAEIPVAESSPETSLEPSLPAPESENAPPTAPTVSQEREPNALEKAIEEVGREILKEEDVEAPAPKDAPKNIEEPAAEPVSTAPFDPNEILSNMISGEGEDVEAQPGEPGIDLGQNDVELPKGEEVDADMLQQLMNRLGTTPVASHVPHEVSETTDNAVEDASVQTEPSASSTENPSENPSEDAVTEPSGELEIEPDDPTTTAVPLVNEILGEDFNVDSLVGPSKEVETPKADETEFVENTEPTGIALNTEGTTLEGFAEKGANEEKPAEKRSDDTVQYPAEQSELGILETDVLGREGVVAFVATEPETAASYRVVQDALGESPTGLTEFREIAQEPLPGGTTTVFSASMLRLRRKKPPTKEV